MARDKKKLISYKPNIQALVKRNSTTVAKDVEKMQKIITERKVSRMVIRGKSYDQISSKLGISTAEALRMTKNITQRWMTDEALEAPVLRELEVKRLDALLELAMFQAFPHPKTDSAGNEIKVRNCDCDDSPEIQDKPCVFEDHNRTVMTGPDKEWAEFAVKIGQRRSALIGLDAADKLESKKAELLERIYKGVGANVINDL